MPSIVLMAVRLSGKWRRSDDTQERRAQQRLRAILGRRRLLAEETTCDGRRGSRRPYLGSVPYGSIASQSLSRRPDRGYDERRISAKTCGRTTLSSKCNSIG